MRRSPEEFESSVVRPSDFDAFWDAILERTTHLPLNIALKPLPLRSTSEVEVFELFYNSLDGVRVAAWYARFRRCQGQLPGLVFMPGYVSDPSIHKGWAKEGYAVLSAAPRGKLRSNRQFNPGYPGLLTHNITDRDTYGYRGFYIDAVRAIDALCALPEVDGERVGVFGSSQGGGLSIVVAALHPRVRAASAGAPFLCGMIDAIALTSSYPYHEIRDYLRLHPERRTAVCDTLAYFDAMNFAPRVRCPVIVNIGLQDNVCPPETGFALFRALGSTDKRLYPYDGHGHEAGAAKHGAVVRAFFQEKLGVVARPHSRPPGDAAPGPLSRRLHLPTESRGEALHSSPVATAVPEAAKTAALLPPNYDTYWERVEAELAALPAAPEEEPLPLRSTAFADCFGVRLTSVGPYRLFAYLSVPRGKGPFPALFQVPRLGSVVDVLSQGDPQARRARYVVLSLACRGQRLSDQPYAAAFPGLLTDGVEAPESYVFRGIVADLLRGLEYLLSRPEVDRSRVLAVGANDLTLLLAGLHPQVTHLVTSVGPFYDARVAAATTAEYPLEEINDVLRAFPDRADTVLRTLAYFDPLHIAPQVRAACLLWSGPEGSPHGPEWLRPLASAIPGSVEVQPTRRSTYLDGKLQEEWIRDQLRFDTPIFPEAWR